MGKMNDVERIKKPRKKDILPTKVVIRRLPQGMTKDDFLAEVGPLPEHDYLSFHAADHSYETAYFSRAYIDFANFADIYAFKNKFDHHNFVSCSGVESLAVVELALFQGVPRSYSQVKRRKDPRCGTIEKDSDYLAFLESLEKEKEPPQSAEVYLEQLETRKAELKASKEVTPLIEFIRSRRAARNAHKHANNEKRPSRKDQELEKESRLQRKKQDEIRKSGSKKPLSNKPHQSDSKPSRETKRHTDSSTSKPQSRRGGERNQTTDKDHQTNRNNKSSSKQYNNSRPSNRPTSSKGSRNEKGKYNQDHAPGTVHPKKTTNSATDDVPGDQTKTEDSKKMKENNDNISPRDKTKRKNKDRPEMAIYRPPSRPSSGKGRDSKSTSKEKTASKDNKDK